MASLTCDICFENFSKLNRLPKFLECGHTLCEVCLSNILQTQKICPTCKATLFKPLEEYPTNFIAFQRLEITNESKSSVYVRNLKDLEHLLMTRKELLLKSIGERTSFKNLVTNGITRIQQMLEMDEGILNFMDGENLIAGLEADVENIDALLYCYDKEDMKFTYSLNDYINTLHFLFEIANRLRRGEEIYAYEKGPKSKPKYGKLTWKENTIDVHVLDLSSVGKMASLVSLQDIKKCITKENFQTFIEIGDRKLSFNIIDSSLLASQFIKLCSGETGPMLKEASCSTPSKVEIPTTVRPNRAIIHGRFAHVTAGKNITQNEYLRIDKFILNDEELAGFNDYDMTIFSDKRETTCFLGDTVVQMFPNGTLEIRKCITDGETFQNVVAKVNKDQNIILHGLNAAVISDSGISLIISK